MATDAVLHRRRLTRSGWGLTIGIGAALLLGSLLLLVLAGTDEAGVRMWTRATARASVALFLMAFVARPLRRFWRSGFSAWLLANRRYVGVSAALAQLLHGVALVWLFRAFATTEQAPDLQTLIGGGLGFAFYFAMALTSSDAAVAALGRRAWKALHTAGAYWVWFVFALTNWGNVELALAGELGLAHQVLYTGIEAALFAALGLRVLARIRANATK
jgi:DMSO/TMAO reductase YedYZ heme-binding membrane subunit